MTTHTGHKGEAMTDIGRLKELEALVDNSGFELRCDNRNVLDLFDGLRLVFPHLLSEIETLRARLAAAERVVEAIRRYDTAIRTESSALPTEYRDALAAYDQGKVTICDSAPTEGE